MSEIRCPGEQSMPAQLTVAAVIVFRPPQFSPLQPNVVYLPTRDQTPVVYLPRANITSHLEMILMKKLWQRV